MANAIMGMEGVMVEGQRRSENCTCGQRIDEGDAFCRQCGMRASMVGSLCGTLSRRAELTFEALASAHRKGWPSSEVTHTEENLRAIHQAHGDRIAIHPFTSDEERLNGADWEWWFYSGRLGFGMRVQAKRANRNGGYDLRYRPDGERYQNDLLIEDAIAEDCLPVYVFYNHTNWPQSRPGKPWVGCTHGPFAEGQLGCTIASALVVKQTLRGSRVSSRYVKSRSRPWNRILCDGSVSEAPILDIAYRRVQQLHRSALVELEELGRTGASPPTVGLPASPALQQLRPVVRPQRVSRADRGSAGHVLGPRDDAAFSSADHALHRRLREMADRPVGRLPQRVQDMVHCGDGPPPDDRVAGAVLINLGSDGG
ncbi:DUF6615 family protein [Streptomyces sp. NPDC038707]|uniref:DUF6615 family protein n=1 Tax=Streptomyces sp. NPDC038707 TaxID=3154329 RepID=UPI0033D0BD27